jgi:hypothetical protein
MILDELFAKFGIGTEIPKPAANAPFRIVRAGTRKGERALIYSIPSRTHPDRPFEKGVTESDLECAATELERSGQFTRAWFNTHLVRAAKEGGCNFTTLGGLLQLLARARYAERATYVRASGD